MLELDKYVQIIIPIIIVIIVTRTFIYIAKGALLFVEAVKQMTKMTFNLTNNHTKSERALPVRAYTVDNCILSL